MAVIGFDTSSWILAEKTRQLGKPFFLDQSTVHPLAYQAIEKVVANSFPEWRSTMDARPPEILQCENREYQLATKIIVASSYSRQTLVSQGVPADKVVINPYGVDTRQFDPKNEWHRPGPFRFLFLGSVCARKGVPLLVKAWERIRPINAELWLVGPITDKVRALIPKLDSIRIKGKIPFEDLPALMRQCDVLVFPSNSDGFGLVLLEALACGLPIITTQTTAGPDLIRHEKEGLLINSGDLDSLCESMSYFLDHPEAVHEMSIAARHCAEKFSWENYGSRWKQILADFA